MAQPALAEGHAYVLNRSKIPMALVPVWSQPVAASVVGTRVAAADKAILEMDVLELILDERPERMVALQPGEGVRLHCLGDPGVAHPQIHTPFHVMTLESAYAAGGGQGGERLVYGIHIWFWDPIPVTGPGTSFALVASPASRPFSLSIAEDATFIISGAETDQGSCNCVIL
jgi:hypothetical protein